MIGRNEKKGVETLAPRGRLHSIDAASESGLFYKRWHPQAPVIQRKDGGSEYVLCPVCYSPMRAGGDVYDCTNCDKVVLAAKK